MRSKTRSFYLPGGVIKAKSGFMPQCGDLSETKCQNCKKPVRSEMTAIIDVIQYGFAGSDFHTTVFQCSACREFTFVDYELDYHLGYDNE